jgi:lipoprotein-anchoring transpeptidase ErfK/SrfK
VLPARAAPVMRVAETESVAPVAAAPVVAAPAAASPPVVAPLPVAAPVVTNAHDTVVPPHVDVPSDKLIRTPLGPFTIPGALLSDRNKEAQYCYTQLGLKYSPELKGEITVKLSLRTDGAVEDAVVTKRSWQGISAGEVESCVRALAHDWTFASNDPSVADGAKSLTFSFAP